MAKLTAEQVLMGKRFSVTVADGLEFDDYFTVEGADWMDGDWSDEDLATLAALQIGQTATFPASSGGDRWMATRDA